jgi:hypothetical protein
MILWREAGTIGVHTVLILAWNKGPLLVKPNIPKFAHLGQIAPQHIIKD